MKKISFLLSLGLIILVASCKKDTPPAPQPSDTIENLQVSPGFDWKTTHDVTITLTGYANSTVEIAYPEGDLIQKAFLKKNEAYTMKLNLPVALKSLQLRYMGHVIQADLEGNSLIYVFN